MEKGKDVIYITDSRQQLKVLIENNAVKALTGGIL
jgi:hypothetical protein